MLRAVWPLALLLGGCVTMPDDPVDRAVIEQLAPIEPSHPHAGLARSLDDAAWRLRLTRL